MGKSFISCGRVTRITLLLLVFAGTVTAQSDSVHVDADVVNVALAKGGVLIDRPQVRVAGGRRDRPGALERQNGTSIFYIHDGEGVFVSDERTQRLAKGDVLVVPSGTTQSFVSVAAPISYLQIVCPFLRKRQRRNRSSLLRRKLRRR